MSILQKRSSTALNALHWAVLKKISRLAYLKRLVDTTPEDQLCDVILEIEEILSIESRKWSTRGLRVHVGVNDIPLAEGETSHWQNGADGSRFLKYETLRRFKRLVEDSEYERARRNREKREVWTKYFTAIAATLAALASVLNFWLTYRRKP